MSDGSLYAIYIDLGSDLKKNLSFLQQKWGKALFRKDSLLEPEYYWLSAARGIYAKLGKSSDLVTLNYYHKIGSSVANIKKISPDFRNKEYPNTTSTDLNGYLDVSIWYFSENKSTIDSLSLSFPNIENLRGILIKKWGMPKKDLTGQEYWKNDNIEYIDAKGNTKKGVFIIYEPGTYGLNNSLNFKSNLKFGTLNN
jgi:hypothetical protein